MTNLVDFTAIKARQQRIWEAGDFGLIATPLVIVGELLCESLDLRAGQRVLDVATGSGNTAISAARRWCEVTGIDYVPALLERGRERAAAERLGVTFTTGDAEAIPFPDGAFDVVMSTFGAMFAPDQETAARELLRVCRSGGKIGMANWTPDGFVGRWFALMSRYVPPAPGLRPPTAWGTEARLRELLGEGVAALMVVRRQYVFRYRSPQHWLEFFGTYFGPTKSALDGLDGAARDRLSSELLDLLQAMNRSGDDTLVMPADYLEVVAIRA